MLLQEKINSIKRTNDIKSFGYKHEDLFIFTDHELEELNKHGLIGDLDISLIKMRRESCRQ